MKRTATIIVGYYGENFGDLLMLKSIISSLMGSQGPILIFSYGDTQALARFVDSYFPGSGVRILGPGLFSFAKACLGASQALWGGGTCFMDEGGTGGVKYLTIARMMGVRVRYLGIGVDSCSSSKTRLSLWIATRIADDILVRDEGSAETVRRIGGGRSAVVRTVPDLAMGVSHPSVDARNGALLCLRDISSYYDLETARSINQKLCDLLVETCKRQGVGSARVLVADAALDAEVSRYAVDYLIDNGIQVRVIEGWKLNDSIDAIAGSEFVISTRLHVGVVAQLSSTPYVLFNYSAKNLKFCQAVGQPGRCLDLPLESEWLIDMSVPDGRLSEALQIDCEKVLASLKESA